MLTAFLLLGMAQPDVEIGQRLTPPALVAGPWEGVVAPGEVAGFSLHVLTDARGSVRRLRLDTYVRRDGKTMRTWWSSGGDRAFVMRAGHLRFDQRRRADAPFDVALDVTYDPADLAWKGTFRNPYYAGRVALRRPSLSDPAAPAGTWRTYSYVTIGASQRTDEYGCLNIGVGRDRALVLWAESHGVFLGDVNAAEPPRGDSYGELYDDADATRRGDEWSFVAGTSMSGDRLTGVLSRDGSSFSGYGEHYGSGVVDPARPRAAFTWTRMQNLECRP
jgi:hypothetical protein